MPPLLDSEEDGEKASWILSSFAAVMGFFAATRLAGDLPLPLVWALVGAIVFALGLVLSSRPYRILSLGVLAVATCHILAVDVWKLETWGRIVSFASVGAILVVLGFFYNRYSEKLSARG